MMNLTKYNSEWSPFTQLRDHMNRLFDLGLPARSTEAFGNWSPALDAYEDKDRYTVCVELPGLKKEDISVTVDNGVLTISGERKSEKEVDEGTLHRSERFYGRFSRSVSLPTAVKSDGVGATYRDGILKVEIPKAEEAKPKNIEVKVS
jgi:HSP20 family protein